MRLIADQVTMCGIPSQNQTTPSAVPGLSVSYLAGSVILDWGTPQIRPVGTRFVAFESTTSNFLDAASVFEGDATHVLLVRDTTQRYYWVRAEVGSYSGPLTPTSYGLPVQAPAQVASGSGLMISAIDGREYLVAFPTYVTSGATATAASPGATYVGAAGAVTAAWSVVGGYPATIINGTTVDASFRVTSVGGSTSILSATARLYLTDGVSSVQADCDVLWQRDTF